MTENNSVCAKNAPTHGGYRPGSGRKPTGRTRRTFQLTDTECTKLKELLEQIRTTK